MENKDVGGSDLDLTTEELRGLLHVKKTIERYGDRLRKLFDKKSTEGMLAIVKEVGYHPVEVAFGTRFLNTHNEEEVITKKNAVRIGKGNILYVGIDDTGEIPDFAHLAHDVATCVLGGKQPKEGTRNKIRISTFNSIAQRHLGRTYTVPELDKMGILTKGKDKVARNYLFEAMVYYRKLPFGLLKNLE